MVSIVALRLRKENEVCGSHSAFVGGSVLLVRDAVASTWRHISDEPNIHTFTRKFWKGAVDSQCSRILEPVKNSGQRNPF